MACFVVPVAEAIVTSVAIQLIKKHEREETLTLKTENGFEEVLKTPFSRKLKWLSNLLWGGSVLLLFEHIWHGEVVPWFPFLTAASSPTETATMLHEIATNGVAMAVLVTAVWGVLLIGSLIIEKQAGRQTEKAIGETQ